MKIQISENLDQIIQGFTMVPIVYGEADLSKIPNNAASTIVAIDAVDTIKIDNISQFISNLCSKMRYNCELHIGGTDAYATARSLLGGSTDIVEYNKNVSNKRGLYSAKFITDLLHSNGIDVKSVVYKGYNYEIFATRNYDKN